MSRSRNVGSRTRAPLAALTWALAACSGTPETPDPVQTLLTPTDGAFALAVDDVHVYLRAKTDDVCRIERLSIDGGPVEALVTDLPCGRGLALDETHVYWTEAKADGTVETLLEDFGERRGGTALIVVEDTLFLSAVVDEVGQPWRIDVSGGTPVPIEVPNASTLASDFAENDGWLYWTDLISDFGNIWRASLDSVATERVSHGSSDPTQLVVDDTHVYWTGRDAVHRAPREGGPSTSERLVRLGGEATYGLAQLGDRLVVGSVPKEAPGNPRRGVWSLSKTGEDLRFVSEYRAGRFAEGNGAVYWLSENRLLRYLPVP